ncbi:MULTISPECIES: flavin-containing monooxygenase [Methylobacterium]|uniref:flavin-containing monooxygenase n=1 Tax=Methylobacterium TaxID=407 RepID=UPI0013EBABAB|nr:NAD(P)/FAD-dependent oxidoreductase [Methylobacterium sp. DB0501]NGM34109.1 NAD(P)/FAD-dependent oxidoreductase [Methylobacterium sp. DB0501]
MEGDKAAVRRVDGPGESLDVVIVGAGFAGLYMLHRVRALGLSVRVYEAGSDVGGTWYWNRYPGARCDVESMQYSYSFDEALQQDWRWSERFAGQPEILAYANHVADRFDLRRDIAFDTRIEAAHWDEAASSWRLSLPAGRRAAARFLVLATGCLSAAKMPEIPGLGSFAGPVYHTGTWPRDPVDFAGKRVAVIGTGSSGIQAIPVLAEEASHLTVYQRTPNYSLPAGNGPMTAEYEAGWKRDYVERRRLARTTKSGTIYEFGTRSALAVDAEERSREYAARWAKGGANFMHAFNDLALSQEANDTAAEFVRERIAGLVEDPRKAAILSPRDYPIGTKRICLDTRYFETFNRDDVDLVDLRADPIEAITPRGVRTRSGERAFDALVLATGFDAMTGALLAIDLTGRDGERLADKWAAGPRNHLGLMPAGFPNLFTITGPGSPSVLSNVIVSIEQHVEWIAGCLGYLKDHGYAVIASERDAEDAWVAHVNEVAHRTLYPRAASWYMGANVPGKPRVFMPYIGGVGAYREHCATVAAKGYEGFTLEHGIGRYGNPTP